MSRRRSSRPVRSAGGAAAGGCAPAKAIKARKARTAPPAVSSGAPPAGLPRKCRDWVSVGEMANTPLERSRSNRAWKNFRADRPLKRAHGVSPGEITMLSDVALMGEVCGPADFVYILNTLRSVLER